MAEAREVVILSGVRTAIGDYGGSLKDIPPSELAARVVTRSGQPREGRIPKDIGQCVFGNVIHTEPKDMYISRARLRRTAACRVDTGALTLNRLCGSGMQAIVTRLAVHPAGRHRRGGRGRRRKHEPRGIRVN